jgi:hypothetical protein
MWVTNSYTSYRHAFPTLVDGSRETDDSGMHPAWRTLQLFTWKKQTSIPMAMAKVPRKSLLPNENITTCDL